MPDRLQELQDWYQQKTDGKRSSLPADATAVVAGIAGLDTAYQGARNLHYGRKMQELASSYPDKSYVPSEHEIAQFLNEYSNKGRKLLQGRVLGIPIKLFTDRIPLWRVPDLGSLPPEERRRYLRHGLGIAPQEDIHKETFHYRGFRKAPQDTTLREIFLKSNADPSYPWTPENATSIANEILTPEQLKELGEGSGSIQSRIAKVTGKLPVPSRQRFFQALRHRAQLLGLGNQSLDKNWTAPAAEYGIVARRAGAAMIPAGLLMAGLSALHLRKKRQEPRGLLA